ncbi:MAG: 3'-5' exonuclease domain-containing protein 2 [Kiritimatiellae bacterium]|nr:3'-5' exonuclease domain-containing protein 2 [Kiritimatiellia bacterium]MDD5519948.1 3'-5' exonuclease domain-containing protein 2 [Kiritimatiellia bacterium]
MHQSPEYTKHHQQPDTTPGSPPETDQTTGLKRKLSDEEINNLELAVYDGPIHVIRSHKDMLTAVHKLKHEHLLGFDTETRPSFKKGVSYPPALIQLAEKDVVYIFQLHSIKLPRELADILADPGIIKAGVAIGRDIKELRTLTEFEPGGFVDLGIYAKSCGMQHHGLRGLAALLLGCRISKGAKLTRWDNAKLPHHALKYAATDAWIGRRIYEAMEKAQNDVSG